MAHYVDGFVVPVPEVKLDAYLEMHINLDEVDDAAQRFGFTEIQEARFCNEALGTEQTGFSLHRIKPGKRQGFAHTTARPRRSTSCSPARAG